MTEDEIENNEGAARKMLNKFGFMFISEGLKCAKYMTLK
jgi:hypothetical protein